MSIEPCGGLPEIHLTVSVSYCVHHMAWCAMSFTYVQHAEDDLDQVATHRATFGPFDSWADVRDWAVDHMEDPSLHA